MRTFLLCLLALVPAVLFADPLSPPEAQSILRQAQQASREVGSFQEVKTEKTKYGTATVTTYTLIRPDGTRCSRTETVTTVDGHPERTQTSVSLTTAEGPVQLFKHHALLFALKFDRAKILAEAKRPQPNEADEGTPRVAEEPAKKETDGELQDRLLTAAVRIAPHATISGERFVQDGRRRVRVVSSFDEEGQKQMKKLAEDQWAEMKKEIPWALRLLVTPVLAAKGGIAAMLPAKIEYLIDEEQTRMIETTTYNAAGKMLAKKRPGASERIPDLPPETFAIPAGLEVVRASSFFELIRLELKIRKEERDNAKTPPAAPAGS
jgi:hypothetical protein